MLLGEMEIFHQNQNFFMHEEGHGVQQTACQDFLMPPHLDFATAFCLSFHPVAIMTQDL